MNANQLKIDRARWFLLSHSPFYGSLAMALRDEITLAAGPTACTDGRRILWNPAFLESLTEPETRFVLLHEVGHCALGHFWRLPCREPLAQQAADYCVNRMLGASGLQIQPPAGALFEPAFDSLAEEEILAKLRAQQKPGKPGGQPGGQPGNGKSKGKGKGQQPGNGSDPGGCGAFAEPEPEPGKSQDAGAAREEARQHWERAIVTAVQAASATRGNVPGEFARLAEACTAAPSVDWRQETADFFRTAIGTRNDWSRAARRHAWQPVIYPRKRPDEIGTIVAVRDTSGSISDTQLGAFNAVLATAQQELGCAIILLDCDTRIARELRLAPGDAFPPDLAGGGGTDLRPPFARCAELIADGESIAGLVYLTDLEGPEPEADFDFPVLWLCTTGNVAKTGRTVRLSA